jgi:peptide/nickel transport system permease protein
MEHAEPTTRLPAADADVASAGAASPWRLAWRRFRRDRVALASGVFLVFVLFACFPGAKLYGRLIGHGPNDLFPYAVSLSQKPVGPFARVYAAPQTADDDPYQFEHTPPRDKTKTLLVLGADSQLGRDELMRVLYGGRVSLAIAIGAAALAILIGTVLGAIAGYFGGWVDAGVSRFTDLMMAFPVLLFLVVIGSALTNGLTKWTFGGLLNQGVFQLIVLIAAFTWFYPARIVRTQVLSLRHREFVEAAQMVGAGSRWIIRKHLAPHLVPPLLAYAAILVATNIMLEVGATFLNAGIRLPTASWGSLLAQSWGSPLQPRTYSPATTQPWLTVWPSLAIFLTVFALNQFSEGLREATDPRGLR